MADKKLRDRKTLVLINRENESTLTSILFNHRQSPIFFKLMGIGVFLDLFINVSGLGKRL